MSHPRGLDEAIGAFIRGCNANGKQVDTEQVSEKMVERLSADFQEQEQRWDQVKNQLLTVAGLSGRLAALYAVLDKSETVGWTQARKGLRDGQAECVEALGLRLAKHCARAAFEDD